MKKPLLLLRAPIQSYSGYGSHSRDILLALYEIDLFDIKIDSCRWGVTSLNAMSEDTEFNRWAKSRIITKLDRIPDIFVQVSVPNEFQAVGKINIGITAGIETTTTPVNWVNGCNNMDFIIVPSQFSKDVLSQTSYNEIDEKTGTVINRLRITKNIYTLFEGIDTNIFNNQYVDMGIDIPNEFSFLCVGHWLKGEIGQDRKDLGMTITTFINTFKGVPNPPALILKTAIGSYSVIDRENVIKKIKNIVGKVDNPPPVYLLYGNLTDEEMNSLYNHPNIKCMVSLTKGEGFGRPLLEFSLTGKPIIASNWSGLRDFLSIDKSILLGGTLKEVHKSSVDEFIVEGSKWFNVNYNEFSVAMKIMMTNYNDYLNRADILMRENTSKFSLSEMKKSLLDILKVNGIDSSTDMTYKLPKLTRIN